MTSRSINWSFFLPKGVPASPYWVLSSDYQSYALVYSCFDYFGLFHVDFAWVLARTRVLSEDTLARSRQKLSAAGVNVNHLTATNQTGCNRMSLKNKQTRFNIKHIQFE